MGGFTGGAQFTLRLWTARPKRTKDEWAKETQALRRAIDQAGEIAADKKAKVWMDNEKFLGDPAKYKEGKLEVVNFPTNSGDLNPIEGRRDRSARTRQPCPTFCHALTRLPPPF